MWDKFLSYENFYFAFQRLKTAQTSEHKNLYKIEMEFFELFLEKNIYTTLNIIKYEIYTSNMQNNKSFFKFYIPKPKNFVRPITHLNFIDLLIYQAICNIVAESFYEKLSPYYNKYIFGHLYNNINNNNEKKFFYKKWKDNWKNYELKTKEYIDNLDYNYILDFDIASFYDTISHNVLKQVLLTKIDNRIVDLLINLLKISTVDFSRHSNINSNGIPQGPIGSAILAEVFLNYYFDEFMYKQSQANDIKYIRYADDIRIFARNENLLKRYITILDLLCRDIGLIPQASKIEVNFYEKSSDFIKHNNNKFSLINKLYKKNKKLNSKDDRK